MKAQLPVAIPRVKINHDREWARKQKPIPFQNPASDEQFMKAIAALDYCAEAHKERFIFFKCETDCDKYDTCMEMWSTICEACADRKLKVSEYRVFKLVVQRWTSTVLEGKV